MPARIASWKLKSCRLPLRQDVAAQVLEVHVGDARGVVPDEPERVAAGPGQVRGVEQDVDPLRIGAGAAVWSTSERVWTPVPMCGW